VPGFGTADSALVTDLSEMTSVEAGPDARTAKAGGGLTLGVSYDRLAQVKRAYDPLLHHN
jgi:hypothetical protein